MRRALIVVATAVLVIAPAASAWTWPVDGPVLAKFKLGDDPYAGGQHRGIDIGAPTGTAVLAPASGIVSFAGAVPVSGRTLTIQTRDGYSVTLTHLGAASVRQGDTVGEGSGVATVGSSGIAEHEAPYVHLRIRHTEDPNGYVDPLLFLPARPLAPPPAAPPSPAPAPPPPVSAPPAAALPRRRWLHRRPRRRLRFLTRPRPRRSLPAPNRRSLSRDGRTCRVELASVPLHRHVHAAAGREPMWRRAVEDESNLDRYRRPVHRRRTIRENVGIPRAGFLRRGAMLCAWIAGTA